MALAKGIAATKTFGSIQAGRTHYIVRKALACRDRRCLVEQLPNQIIFPILFRFLYVATHK
ncbi:MAG: hypothetical protein HC767_09945 [Akkermansiaceae bacterium]|nr:hypothetical protein [Akkermansiaceae bacterium]